MTQNFTNNLHGEFTILDVHLDPFLCTISSVTLGKVLYTLSPQKSIRQLSILAVIM